MATPASTIPDAYITQFSTSWRHLSQQMESRLKEYVSVDYINGKEKKYNQLQSETARLITSRKAATTETEEVTDHRWLRLQAYDMVSRFDEFDDELLGTIPVPRSETVQKHTMAFNRRCDQTIVDALGGTAYNGATGTNAVTFPSAQTIAVDFKDLTSTTGGGTDYNLTIQKLVQARKLLETAEAYQGPEYGDKLCIAVTANQIAGLLMDAIEVQSSDFNAIKALYEGQITEYGGFRWKRLELLPIASTVRSCFAWVKSGVMLGIGEDRKVYADYLPTQNHSLQLRSTMLLGATRLEENRVIKILCDEDEASIV